MLIVCIPHGVLSVNLSFFARIYSSVVTVGDEANGHVRRSSSRLFVEFGLDGVRWLASLVCIARMWRFVLSATRSCKYYLHVYRMEYCQ